MALTIVALWGSACVYHGLVGNASVVTDLWGTAYSPLARNDVFSPVGGGQIDDAISVKVMLLQKLFFKSWIEKT